MLSYIEEARCLKVKAGIRIAALLNLVGTSKARFTAGKGNSFPLSITAAMLCPYS